MVPLPPWTENKRLPKSILLTGCSLNTITKESVWSQHCGRAITWSLESLFMLGKTVTKMVTGCLRMSKVAKVIEYLLYFFVCYILAVMVNPMSTIFVRPFVWLSLTHKTRKYGHALCITSHVSCNANFICSLLSKERIYLCPWLCFIHRDTCCDKYSHKVYSLSTIYNIVICSSGKEVQIIQMPCAFNNLRLNKWWNLKSNNFFDTHLSGLHSGRKNKNLAILIFAKLFGPS